MPSMFCSTNCSRGNPRCACPASHLEQQLGAVTRPTKAEQKFVSKTLDNVLGPNIITTQGQEVATA